VRVNRCHCAHRVVALWAVFGAAALVTLGGCRLGVPVIDPGPKPLQADGTISGTVRGPEGTSPVEGRVVQVVNIDTGERQRAVTSNVGGFTFKVKPGKYRVELTLLDGEHLVKKPDVLDVDRSDVDAHADFVLDSPSVERPRYHAPRSDDGLGAAIG